MIVGLCGYAGSGKDTVAEILVREHGFTRYAFADKLRELAYAINPPVIVDRDEWYPLATIVDYKGWDAAKREHTEVREFLQNLGVWHRDNVCEDFWVKFVQDAWLADGRPDAVVTDVRFPNEALWVRNHGEFWGVGAGLWRIQRPGVGPVNGHISEQLDLAADATIWNGGTVAQLMLKVHELVREEQAA